MEYIGIVLYLVVFLYSVILHEIAHGFVALHFGDTTARDSGRLSFNPLVHIDPIGSLIVPIVLVVTSAPFLFGWAKPVPVNTYNLKGGDRAFRLVSAAGILTNLTLALISAIILKFTLGSGAFGPNNLGVLFFALTLQLNIVLAVFNALPLPGFDGFNFAMTFRPFAALIERTPLGNPVFIAQYGFILTIVLLFALMGPIGQLFSFIFRIFDTAFGLGLTS